MQSKILQTLHEDHANLVQLLVLIEAEIEKLRSQDAAADFELISLALEYCVDFPGHYHHPKEDLIYAKLIRRDPEIAERVLNLTEDHETLYALTGEVSAAVADAISGTVTERLHDAANRFVRHYRYHIGIEETEVFPCARRALTEEDWREIENAYEEACDPLFGEHTRQAYIALQRCIVERAVAN